MAKGNNSGKGWFQPGQSGNPSGRSKKDIELTERARLHAEQAINTIVEVMNDSIKPMDRLHAAIAILDRAYGRPGQTREPANQICEQIIPMIAIEVDGN